MLNPIRIQMLQLNLIVMEEPQEEAMGGCRKLTIVEVRKRHHIAVGRRREVMAVGHYPLMRGGPCAKKTAIDDALHARVAAIRATP
jgi:hypothetical protein